MSDFDEALDLAERAERAVETLQGRLGMEDHVAQRYRASRGIRLECARACAERRSAGAASGHRPAAPGGAAARGARHVAGADAAAPGQGQEQGRLKEQLGKVADQLGEVGKKVPIFGPSTEQMLQQAQEGMSSAEQRLYRGEPRGAQGRRAAGHREAFAVPDAMEKLAKQAGQSGGQGGMPMPGASRRRIRRG